MLKRTDLRLNWFLKMIGIRKSKYYSWRHRLGIANRHNQSLPKSNWLTSWEREAIIRYARSHYAENDYYLRDGYRRLTYRMLDEDIVAVSPSSVYRILKTEGLLNSWNTAKTSKKGGGFNQPGYPHQHWHVDIKYINFRGTFLFLISVMDGYSRYILHHEVRTQMSEYDVQLTIQRAREKYPDVRPIIISDNGSQFISKDFQEFIKFLELTHIRTSIAYPQSNGKLERFHRSLGMECLNTKSFITLEDARETIACYVDYYNRVRLHSSLFFLTPEDFLLGRVKDKIAKRELKLKMAAQYRALYWQMSNAA